MFAFDAHDAIFSGDALPKFAAHVNATLARHCADAGVRAAQQTLRCEHDAKPAWAQNDAVMAAYLDEADYIYRINDDTKLVTKNWTAAFVAELRGFSPPNVGVVGPNNAGGETARAPFSLLAVPLISWPSSS